MITAKAPSRCCPCPAAAAVAATRYLVDHWVGWLPAWPCPAPLLLGGWPGGRASGWWHGALLNMHGTPTTAAVQTPVLFAAPLFFTGSVPLYCTLLYCLAPVHLNLELPRTLDSSMMHNIPSRPMRTFLCTLCSACYTLAASPARAVLGFAAPGGTFPTRLIQPSQTCSPPTPPPPPSCAHLISKRGCCAHAYFCA